MGLDFRTAKIHLVSVRQRALIPEVPLCSSSNSWYKRFITIILTIISSLGMGMGVWVILVWMIMGLLRLLIVSSNRHRLSPDEILPHLLLSIKDSPSLLSVEATATATLITITASSSPHLRGSTPHLQDPEWVMGHRRRRPLR
jgi:hypothetical protein